MKVNDIQYIGVLGAGLMGHAIAQVFASAGYNVHLYDADAALLEKAFGVAVQQRLAAGLELLT